MQIKPIYELLLNQREELIRFAHQINDATAINSYMLLEVESQLRGSKPQVKCEPSKGNNFIL